MFGLAHRGWSLNDYGQHLIHPLREADGVADRGVGGAAAPVDRPGDDLAGVDPDPGREVEAVLAPQLGGVLGDVLAHLQRRVAGALGVVLDRLFTVWWRRRRRDDDR